MQVLLKAPLDDHKPGETVELLDHHAKNLIALGFAEAVAAKPASAPLAPKPAAPSAG